MDTLRSRRVLLALIMTNLLICAEKELNPGPAQPTETLKSQDTFVKANDDNVDKRKPATMSERQQEKVPADLDSLKSKPTSVQGSLNKSDANISDRKSKTSLLYRKLKGNIQKPNRYERQDEEMCESCKQ